ncbi:MAG: SUMF1/EgtB/PvdO family nonheme iron enzyme [Thiomargarita sp.]|nr:SUMF1/EgtB/PvdO family nonheme iron enzyme [Thiomargarita sp.]
MSSINQAKAETQKLIKRYHRLQAEAKTADTAEEAARKATEADKLVSQINALQLAVAKLQGKNKIPKKTVATSAKTEVKKSIKKTVVEDRINRLEEAQKRTRTQIEQLSNAKAQLAHLKHQAEKSVANNEEKLQQELARLIKKKEAEHQALRRELEHIRQQATKEADLLKVQRDTARAVMERQKKAEKEHTLAAIRHGDHKGLLLGVIIGIIFSLILGGLFLFIVKKYEPVKKSRTEPVVHNSTFEEPTENESPSLVPKQAYQVRTLGKFHDKLRHGKGPLMVKLSGGTFKMGSKIFTHTDERPQHEVTLHKFSISRYEITFEEYDLFAKSTGHPFPDDMGWGRIKRPVINVNWEEANDYTKWLTKQTGHQYRLPSEREWEYAAAAGRDTIYWWGYRIGKNNANCGMCDSKWDGMQTAPVGDFKPNPLGLYDTIGNVMEWTISCFRPSYQGAPSKGHRWKGGNCSWYIVRSSSFRTYDEGLRTTKRNKFSPGTRLDTIGFRVVRVD